MIVSRALQGLAGECWRGTGSFHVQKTEKPAAAMIQLACDRLINIVYRYAETIYTILGKRLLSVPALICPFNLTVIT